MEQSNQQVEIGMLLDGDIDFFDNQLKNYGAKLIFNVEVHDRYFTKKSYDELASLSEKEIKMSCVRIRQVEVKQVETKSDNQNYNKAKEDSNTDFEICFDEMFFLTLSDESVKNKISEKELDFVKQFNFLCNDKNGRLTIGQNECLKLINILEKIGYYLIFDTFKEDYQYKINSLSNIISLQEIDSIGLVLYYDNPEIYSMPKILQRKTLIDEINSVGFNFKYEEMGIDKLRTLLFGYATGSFNQNE